MKWGSKTCAVAEMGCKQMDTFTGVTGGSKLFAAVMHNMLKPDCGMDGLNFFCPIVMACIPNTYQCTIDTEHPDKDNKLPWGGTCSVGLTFCYIFQVCIPRTVKCSMRTILNWFQGDHKK